MMMKRKKTSEWAKSRILLAVPIITVLLLCFGCKVNSQDANESTNETAIDGVLKETPEIVEGTTDNQDDIDIDEKLFEAFEVEVSPEYPGGMEALYKFLGETLIYPMEAREKGIQGKVYVQFIVKKDGSVGHVKIARGLDKLCDEECIRVMKLMPKWTPGKQNGKAVAVNYILPVMFTLKADEDK
jgi:TonB family protein